MSHTFPKSQRLCGQTRINAFYSAGRRFVSWPLRVTYIRKDDVSSHTPQDTEVLVWAPKSLFRHAVDRNRLRRLMREAWRLQQHSLNAPYVLAFNYMDKSMQPFEVVSRAVTKAISRLNRMADGSRSEADETDAPQQVS